MITRHTDAHFLNEIANDPDVRPWLGAPELGALDLAPIVADERNHVLLGCAGGFVCLFLMEGIYECHALFRRGTPPGAALQTAREGARLMFCATPCIEILTRIPDGHFATKMLGEKIGFRKLFFGGVEAFGGHPRSVHVWRLGLDDWKTMSGHGYPDIAGEMLLLGQPQKGLVWYNRWALLARRPVARTLAELQERLESAPDA